MYRLMQPSDWAEVLALWQAQRGDTEEFVRGAVERFAGCRMSTSRRKTTTLRLWHWLCR